MKVILLSNVQKVGKKYDVVDVAPGYARNFLFTNNLAEPVTPSSAKRVAELQKKRALNEKQQGELMTKALSEMKDLVITMTRAANDSGHLYAGITAHDLSIELDKILNVAIPPERILLSKPIKNTGESVVEVDINGKKREFTVIVNAE